MSSLITITAKAVTLQGYQLTSYNDMISALAYLVGLTASPYTGAINYQQGVWSLSLYNTSQSMNQTGVVGDWVILQNGTIASICKASNYAALYN